MSPARPGAVVVLVLAVFLGSGCSDSATPTGSTDTPASTQGGVGSPPEGSSTNKASDAKTSGGNKTAPSTDGPLGQSQPGGAAFPSPPNESNGELPEASATLDPPCVRAGDKVILTVDTGMSYSGVAYLAYYAGDKNGGKPPYGDGYGGNGAGPTDADGRYVDAWIVRPDTPRGSARVEVSILYRSEQRQDLTIPFRVIDTGDTAGVGGC